MKTRRGSVRVLFAALVLAVFGGMTLVSCQENLASKIEGKWQGDVNKSSMEDEELDGLKAEYEFKKADDNGGDFVTVLMASYSTVEDDMRIKADISFKMPGKWSVGGDGVIDLTYDADKMDFSISNFDMKPTLDADEETIAGLAMAKAAGMLDGDAVAEGLKELLEDEMKAEFADTEHTKMEDVKVEGDVLTFTDAELGKISLKRVK